MALAALPAEKFLESETQFAYLTKIDTHFTSLPEINTVLVNSLILGISLIFL